MGPEQQGGVESPFGACWFLGLVFCVWVRVAPLQSIYAWRGGGARMPSLVSAVKNAASTSNSDTYIEKLCIPSCCKTRVKKLVSAVVKETQRNISIDAAVVPATENSMKPEIRLPRWACAG